VETGSVIVGQTSKGVGAMDEDESNRNLDTALDGIDEAKRATLRRLIVKGAFVTPVVASFAMAGLSIDDVAQAQNTTATTTTISGVAGAPIKSDRRLKTEVARVGTHSAGFGLYRFRYLWSDEEHVGVIAQEVREVMPQAVLCGEDGFLQVDYRAIGMEMVPYASWKAAAVAGVQATTN
jgi:hypothetical protein